MDYIAELQKDVRIQEGMHACMNCGVCTAICPAAELYNYDPRIICNIIQSKNNDAIEELLKSETIWYCGECMSCKTRCPRGNTVGLIIMALRSLSQELGFFTESEKGRQQLYLKRTIGEWMLTKGYCLYLEGVGNDLHPEQGPIWDWIQENYRDVFERLGANYQKEGPGILRKIPDEVLAELKSIYDVTGGLARYEQIEKCSAAKAKEMNMQLDETFENEYISHIYTANQKNHTQL